MATETQIGNLALTRAGITQYLTDLDTDTSNDAAALRAVFDLERDFVLRDYPWPWARKHATLELLSTNPNSDWLYSYRYPADCVLVRRLVTALGRQETDPPPFSVGRDGSTRAIFTNEASAKAEYTLQVTAAEDFDSIFVSMFAWRLASELALSRARSPELATTCLQAYAAERAQAITKAAAEAQHTLPAGADHARIRELLQLALTRIGVSKSTVSADIELSLEALWPRINFAIERDFVLRDCPWPWARKYAALVLMQSAPNSDWAYSYRYPADCLFVRRIVTAAGRGEADPPEFAIGSDDSGQIVYTNETAAVAEYTRKVTDPDQFDAHFISLMAWRIGATLAPGLSKIDKMADVAMERYQAEKAAAINRAMLEGERAIASGSSHPVGRKIFHLALTRLGITKNVLVADSEYSLEALWPRVDFAEERDFVLRDFEWPFATEYATLELLAGSSTEPVNGHWTFAHAFPADALMVRRIVGPGGRTDTTRVPFRIGRDASATTLTTEDGESLTTEDGEILITEGTPARTVFADLEEPEVEYTKAITDPSEFDPIFLSMMAWRIAGLVGPGLKKPKEAAAAMQMYDYEKQRAQCQALNEGQADDAPDAEWIRGR